MTELMMCIKCGIRPRKDRLPGANGQSPRMCEVCAPRPSEKGLERQREYNRLRYARNPSKHLARSAVKHALETGRIVHAPCAVCHRLDVPLEAHHHDYSQALNVTWLCIWHHALIEQALDNRPADEETRAWIAEHWPSPYASESLLV